LRRGAARDRFAPAHREVPGRDTGELAARRRRDHRARGLRRGCEEEVPAGLESGEALPADRQAAAVGGLSLRLLRDVEAQPRQAAAPDPPRATLLRVLLVV